MLADSLVPVVTCVNRAFAELGYGERGEAARSLGLLAVGALWGFGSREELQTAGADVLVDAPAGLLDVL